MRPPPGTRPPGPGGPEYASPTPALRMRIVSAAESSATGTSINPDAVARLPGCPPPRSSAWAACKLRAGGSRRGGRSGKPPALMDRLPNSSAWGLLPLHRVGPSLPLGETLLGLQQPMHHQQLAHQVIQGLAGGPPVRIRQRPSKKRVGLLALLRRHPPRVGH